MIIILFLLVIIIVLTIIFRKSINFIILRFSSGNALVYGKRRKGKDLLFQNVIARRHEDYFSNISYGYKYNNISLSELSVAPNTYDNMINDDIRTSVKNLKLEGKDIYISDGAIYLPSQYHDKLIKKYPSMPIFYAVQGHLYNNRTHVNYNGSFNRLWDKLREQAEEFFLVLYSINLGFGFITVVRYYELMASAESRILPFSRKMVLEGGDVRAQRKLYQATHGMIKTLYTFQWKHKIKYDTRIFEKKFFHDADFVDLPLSDLVDDDAKDENY